jgi:transcriptional regulator with XRE-family HTH domain
MLKENPRLIPLGPPSESASFSPERSIESFVEKVLQRRGMRWDDVARVTGAKSLSDTCEYVSNCAGSDPEVCAFLIMSRTHALKLDRSELGDLFAIFGYAPDSQTGRVVHSTNRIRGRDRKRLAHRRIGDRIRAVREAVGLSREEVARKLRIPVASIEEWEDNERADETARPLATIARLGRLFGVNIHCLLSDAQPRAETLELFRAELGDDANVQILRQTEDDAADQLISIDNSIIVREFICIKELIEDRVIRNFRELGVASRKYRINVRPDLDAFVLRRMLAEVRSSRSKGTP